MNQLLHYFFVSDMFPMISLYFPIFLGKLVLLIFRPTCPTNMFIRMYDKHVCRPEGFPEGILESINQLSMVDIID